MIFSDSRGDALQIVAVLDGLHDGDTNQSLELLEEHLDNTVLKLSVLTEQADPIERKRIIETLRLVRDYRVRHPRQTTARGDEGLLKSLRELQEQVRRILDETG